VELNFLEQLLNIIQFNFFDVNLGGDVVRGESGDRLLRRRVQRRLPHVHWRDRGQEGARHPGRVLPADGGGRHRVRLRGGRLPALSDAQPAVPRGARRLRLPLLLDA
jgi:hypothetical protein